MRLIEQLQDIIANEPPEPEHRRHRAWLDMRAWFEYRAERDATAQEASAVPDFIGFDLAEPDDEGAR